MFKRYTYSNNSPSDPSSGSYSYKQLRRFGFSDAIAKYLCIEAKIHSVADGGIIDVRGAEAEFIRLVISGMVLGRFDSPNAPSAVVDVYSSGAWFGEIGVVEGLQSPLTFSAAVDSDIMSIPLRNLRRIDSMDASLGLTLTNLIARRKAILTERLVLARQGSTCAKVIVGLALLAEALIGDRDTAQADTAVIELTLSQQGLASVCGVSRTVFSGIIGQLERLRMVELHYGKVNIVNIDQWSRALQKFRLTSELLVADSVEMFT